MLAKGALFCVLGVLAAAVLLLGRGSIGDAALLALSVWAFCRAYYFAFYVIERYADPAYRYAGLWHAARHLLKTRGLRRTSNS